MAETVIGKAALMLTTNARDLISGLGKAEKKIDKFTKETKEKSSSWFGKGMWAAAGMAVFNGISNAITGVLDKYKELKDGIDATAKASRRLGIANETMQGLQHAAALSGVKTELLVTSLEKLRTKVTGPIDEALYNLAERYKATSDEQEKAMLLTEAFGKTGVKLGNLFEGGKDALASMVDEAKKLGFALTDEEAARIEAANDAAERAQRAFDGLYQKIVVQLAPAFEYWSNQLTKMYQYIAPAIDWLARGMDRWLKIALAIGTEVVEILEHLYSKSQEYMQSWFGSTAKWVTIEEVVTNHFKGIGLAAAHSFDTIMLGIGTVALAVGKLIQALKLVHDQFLKTAQLAKALPDHLRPKWVDRMIGLTEKINKNMGAAGDGLTEWGHRQIATWGDSAKQLNAWFDNIGKEAGDNMLAKAKKAADEMEDIADKSPNLDPIAAAVKGSAEAYSIEARFKMGNILGKDDIAKKQLAEQQKQNQKMDKLIQTVGGMNFGLGVI